MLNKNLPPVLLVEDSPDDIEFARRAFARCQVEHPLIIAEEGSAALELLTGDSMQPAGLSSRAPLLRPALVILDLNVPGIHGRELLRRIKNDERLRQIPVVVLTTSTHRADIDACYWLGANAFHHKSHDLKTFQDTMRQITSYWLSSASPAVLSGERSVLSLVK